MVQFYFNDCLPKHTLCNVEAVFYDVMCEYLKLRKDKYLQISTTLAIGELPEKTVVCGITLKDILSSYRGKREEKTVFFALFRSAIVLSNQWDDFVDPNNLYKDFSFNGRNAQYLAVASDNGMIAISLPIEEPLRNNTLDIDVFDTISEQGESPLKIENWYKDNTDYIRPLLLPRAENQLDTLKNFFSGIGKRFVFSDKFKDQWNYEINNDNTKDRIIKRFEEASRGGLLFPAKDDPRESKYKIVRKDDRETGVFELRLRDIGVRIYFACDYNTIKILLYGTKTSHQGNGQESDFRIANSILNKM
jgi:hypothetical protein